MTARVLPKVLVNPITKSARCTWCPWTYTNEAAITDVRQQASWHRHQCPGAKTTVRAGSSPVPGPGGSPSNGART